MGQFIDAPHEGPFVAYHKNADGNGCRSKKRADGGTNREKTGAGKRGKYAAARSFLYNFVEEP